MSVPNGRPHKSENLMISNRKRRKRKRKKLKEGRNILNSSSSDNCKVSGTPGPNPGAPVNLEKVTKQTHVRTTKLLKTFNRES